MVKNLITYHEEYVEIIPNGKHSDKRILIDKVSLPLLGNNTVVYNSGYARIRKDGVVHRVHNLVLGSVTDRQNVIDHKNGNTLDNRVENLRNVTQRVNARNKHKCAVNTTGVIGVSERTRGNYTFFRAQLTLPDSELLSSGQGVRVSKNFNICKLGRDEALKYATEWIVEQKHKLNY